MTLLGIDVSHHQGVIDFPAVKRAGYSFVVIKATEGVGYTDPMFAMNRAKARAAGLTVGAYHFARAGAPPGEADYFCAAVGSLVRGELVVLDWEVPFVAPGTWCRAWLDRVRAKLGVKPLIYMNTSALAGSDWSPVVAGDYGLWLAKYDGNLSVPSPGRWPNVAIKQFTDAQAVSGIRGRVDADVFFGDAVALAKYGKAAPTPAPPPVLPAHRPFLEELMAVSAADKAELIKDIADEVWKRPIHVAAVGGKPARTLTAGQALQECVNDLAAIRAKPGS